MVFSEDAVAVEPLLLFQTNAARSATNAPATKQPIAMPAAAPDVIVEPDDEALGDCVALVPFAGTDMLGNEDVLEDVTDADASPTADELDVKAVSPTTALVVDKTACVTELAVAASPSATEVVDTTAPSPSKVVEVGTAAVAEVTSAMVEVKYALVCCSTRKIRETVTSESDRPWKKRMSNRSADRSLSLDARSLMDNIP